MSENQANQGRLPVLVNLTTNESYQIVGPSTALGRAPENQVLLPEDGYASAHHARVYFDQGRWWLEDLGSSNGTFVNDQVVSGPYQLNPNDVIKVGRTHFRIQ
jgi:pSer/pThr/pTyr-binding forkhead associated (FHA) protein